MSLPNFDVEMMRLFLALYDRGSLSNAAEELNLSIAAASRVLAKLRIVFTDELFVRCAHGMMPTPRAQELCEPIRAMLTSYGELFARSTFHPTTLERTVRIGGVDNAVYSFIRPALPTLFTAAPKMALDLRPLSNDFLAALKTGALDLAVYPVAGVPDEFEAVPLCTEALVWAVRRGHPLAETAAVRPLTEDDLNAYRRVCVSLLGGARTRIEESESGPFARTGDIPAKAAHTAVWTTYFAAAAVLASDSDFVTALPLRLARDAALSGSLAILGKVEGADPYEPALIWHRSRTDDPMLTWLRAVLVSTARDTEVADGDLPVVKRFAPWAGTMR